MTKEITPGTIVHVSDMYSESDSRFAIVVPHSYWETIADEDTKEKLTRCETNYPNTKFLTLVEMTTGFGIEASLGEIPFVVLFFSLFDPKTSRRTDIKKFRCFTNRDGSRYYREFLAEVIIIKEFLDGKKMLHEYPNLGFRKGLIEALNAWHHNHDREEVSSSST